MFLYLYGVGVLLASALVVLAAGVAGKDLRDPTYGAPLTVFCVLWPISVPLSVIVLALLCIHALAAEKGGH